jgi:ribosomal protein S27AE
MLPGMNKPPVVKVDRPNFICPHCGLLASSPGASPGALLLCPKCGNAMSNAKAEDRHKPQLITMTPAPSPAGDTPVNVLLRIEKLLDLSVLRQEEIKHLLTVIVAFAIFVSLAMALVAWQCLVWPAKIENLLIQLFAG